MDETQIRKWLRRPEREKLAPWLIEGLADVPAPELGNIASHIRVYEAFMACCPVTVDLMPAVVPDKARCPNCTRMVVPGEKQGDFRRCPHCQASVRFPVEAES